MRRAWRAALALALLGATLARAELAGRVVDARSGAAIGEAIVTVDERAIRTDADGRFLVDGFPGVVRVRAAGYRRTDIATAPAGVAPLEVRLEPFAPKALYLSFYGIGNARLRGAALDLIRRTPLNALVIDVKGDRGLVAFPSKLALAGEVGAQRVITIPDLPALLRALHAEGVYTIARIVVFKDDPLAGARPDWAVRRRDGSVFRDREGLRWIDPSLPAAWDYDLAIAADAAEAGFDEIQFDYVRFPDSRDVQFSQPNTEANRTRAINGFLDAARERLTRYNVFLAVDVFGYVCWNLDDTHIGQSLEAILPRVDYLSPMLYPSGFQFGIPGYPNPVAHVSEIVGRSLARVRERTHASPQRVRPWLQAFRDYAFDRREFGPPLIEAQIRAAEAFGSNGWMLWNPRNVYPADLLQAQPPGTAGVVPPAE